MANASTNEPDDYVIATGRMESVRKFVEISGEKLGWSRDGQSKAIIWEGKGVNEVGRRSDTNEIVVELIKGTLGQLKLINF